jgi:hypothetical protein
VGWTETALAILSVLGLTGTTSLLRPYRRRILLITAREAFVASMISARNALYNFPMCETAAVRSKLPHVGNSRYSSFARRAPGRAGSREPGA